MADVTSSILKMNDVEIAFQQNLSEQLFVKMAANINGLIDRSANFSFNFYTSSSTWNKPTNARRHIVICTGAGGSGGSAEIASLNQAIGGAGGGAGGTAIKFWDSSDLNSTESVTINGSGSTFKGITALVGSAGENGRASAPANAFPFGGNGGGWTGSPTPDLVFSGGAGHSAIGQIETGGTRLAISGMGGSSFWGGAIQNRSASGASGPSYTPAAGEAWGCGGTGALRANSTSGTTSGGLGGIGIVLIINLF